MQRQRCELNEAFKLLPQITVKLTNQAWYALEWSGKLDKVLFKETSWNIRIMNNSVIAVSCSKEHNFSKKNLDAIQLIKDFGVEGDAHAGNTIQHLYLVKKDATRKNIRQVHLIQIEVLNNLSHKGFSVSPGILGENITTQGIDLLNLPVGTQLHIGNQAVIELTALRNPCVQIEKIQKGILKELVKKNNKGNIIRKLGVMGIVLTSGQVKPNDAIKTILPSKPHQNLEYTW